MHNPNHVIFICRFLWLMIAFVCRCPALEKYIASYIEISVLLMRINLLY